MSSDRRMSIPSAIFLPPFAALEADTAARLSPLRSAIGNAYRQAERAAVHSLLAQAQPDDASREAALALALARRLVAALRERRSRASGVDALMHEFSLSSEEGIALMCLAEALLRIPDRATADRLIADKIGRGDWRRHLGESPSLFVNAAAWGLLVTGKLVGAGQQQGLAAALTRLIARGGEPLIRSGVDLAMRMLGNQFITGQTIEQALANSRAAEARGYRYSYDMLGEAALTQQDADRYYGSYETALHAIGRAANGRSLQDGPGISVKLSALHPRYVRAQRARVMEELLPRLKKLLLLARRYGVGLNIDAEEADRLELSLDLMEALASDPDLEGFDGIGFVVQAYQKRCPSVIDWIADLARRSGRKFMVRLVKGAYWDAEIKRAQADGMPGYPVYTRKVYTDVSYLVCARKLLACADVIYPQFATHNAHTLATIHAWAQKKGITGYEFQCLHGMGESLYDEVVGPGKLGLPCRIYAPVGSHETLLAYLVRRLLENGANSSFVNQVVDDRLPIESLLADPFERAAALDGAPHPAIPLPADLYGSERKNSAGLDLTGELQLRALAASLQPFSTHRWHAAPLPGQGGDMQRVFNPADRRDMVGQVIQASDADVEQALSVACAQASAWAGTAVERRASALRRAADLFEQNRAELLALAIREAGKTLPNAVAELREAVDFLRYYAAQAESLPGTVPLGPVACISPWNFPLAIFTGQVAAALAAGNVVLAKPAEQTPLIAHRAVQLLHEAGIPVQALQLLPGPGETVGAALVADRRVRGVIFTGSTDVARLINRTLAQRTGREGIEIPLIAETGGQNAMIVDSSALPEQVVQDVLMSGFDSAGQRCSALRVLCLQTDIADRILSMLKGAMRELRIGAPDRLATDVGPVIDAAAQQALQQHVDAMRSAGRPVFQLALPADSAAGTFVAPAVIEIGSLAELEREVFGPVVHVLRYRRDDLPQVIDAINGSGYGLTLGIHSRIDATIALVCTRARVGNSYVNRNMVGAVVGVQPFGGEGRSGTGPKAGGPLYLRRLVRDPAENRLPPGAAKNPVSLPALAALSHWAAAGGRQALAALANDYSDNTPLSWRWNLAGPTGEANTLSCAARGAVLCAAANQADLLEQLAAALATGNQAVLDASAASLLPDDLPAGVRASIRRLDSPGAADAQCQRALIDRRMAAQWLPQLAEGQDALVPAILTDPGMPVGLWQLVAERAVCINTAAAGGNASLMALGG